MSTMPSPPIIGQDPWGSDLNTYLAALEARITTAEGRVTTAEGRITTVASAIGTLDARVKVLENVPPPATTLHAEWSLAGQTATPPNNGQLRSDAATNLKAATKLWFSNLTDPGNDITNVWNRMVPPIGLYIQDKNDATKWVKLHSAVVPSVPGTYAEFTVAHDSDSGVAFGTGVVSVVFSWT